MLVLHCAPCRVVWLHLHDCLTIDCHEVAEAPSNPRSHNWGMVECGAVPVPNEAMQVIEEGSRVDSTWRCWWNREALYHRILFSCVQSTCRGRKTKEVCKLISGIVLGGAIEISFISIFLHFLKWALLFYIKHKHGMLPLKWRFLMVAWWHDGLECCALVAEDGEESALSLLSRMS